MVAAKLSKEQRELWHFNCLQRHCSFFPRGIAVQAKPPHPDFIISDEGQSVGIELTEYLRGADRGRGSLQRKRESNHEEVLARAREYAHQLGSPAVGVRVWWLDHQPLRKRRRRELSREIAQLVAEAFPAPGQRITLENTGLSDCPVPDEIESIAIDRWIPRRHSDWAVPMADYSQKLEIRDVAGLIFEKETRLPGYLRYCKEVWLVCVIEGFRPSSFVDISQSATDFRYETGFQKILILRVFEGQVLELNVRRPHAG